MADSQRMLDAWIRRMVGSKVLAGDEAGVRAELSGWIDLLERASLGEAWAETELTRLVAFHGRNHGAEGRPASAVLTQLMVLEEVLEDEGRSELRSVVRKLMCLTADAHEAGATQRLVNKHRAKLAAMAPVLRLEGAIVGFLIGPMEPEILDALFGRVLRESVRAGAKTIVVDCLGADEDDELFHRTILGMQSQPPGNDLDIVFTGLRDPERTKVLLRGAGANLDRIDFREDVSQVIQAATSAPS